MKIIAVIPTRMASTRFPGKPLVLIRGLPMIEHIRRRVSMCKILDQVIVATCDEEIKRVVEAENGTVVMTSDVHERCTDRVAEVIEKIDTDIVINVQGDEPLVMPEMMEEVTRPLLEDNDLPAVNLVTRITDIDEFEDPNAPKVVTNKFGDLLYISRESIPSRKKTDSFDYTKLKQLGIIAFRSNFLKTFTRLEPTPLEKIESVDMMRAVEHGYRVKIVETKWAMKGVDVPDDLKVVEKLFDKDPLLGEYI